MQTQSYYRIADGTDCDLRVEDCPLAVNCTGIYVNREPFASSRRIRRDIYLMYLARGELEVAPGDAAGNLRAGEMLLYPPDRPFSYRQEAPGDMTYYWVHFSGGDARELLARCGLEMGKIYAPGSREEIAAEFQKLFRCFYAREPLFETEAAGRLTALLAKLSRWAREEDGKPPTVHRIRQSLDYLYRNYARPVRLEDLARMEHLSPSRYSAVFRSCMGVSPQGFLIYLRIKNAADLLCRTDLSMAQVAQAVGYDDPLYFSALFRRKMGMAPSRYREEFGGG